VPAHDVNCLALAGVLAHIGRAEGPPVVPLNIIGDFGGGGLLLAFGVVSAVLEVARSGRGQVVDAAMLDGLTLLMAGTFAMLQQGSWSAARGTNALDGGAPFYTVYRTSDDRYVSVGAMEPQFYASLLELTGFGPSEIDELVAAQHDRARWPEVTERLAAVFATRSAADWEVLADECETCLAPVLGMADVPAHPHLVARGSFLDIGGLTQPAPAPRFSRTPGVVVAGAPVPGSDTRPVLAEWGLGEEQIADLVAGGVVADRGARVRTAGR
jgi:alpha-methylacyl-CoA racemase